MSINKKFKIKKDNESSFFDPIEINIDSLNKEVIQFTDNYGSVYIHKNQNFYLFSKNEEGNILETPDISLGEKFHIMYSKNISYEIKKSLIDIVGDDFQRQRQVTIGNYIVITNLKANKFSTDNSIIKVNKEIQIKPVKGLKINGVYLKSAPPNIQILGKFSDISINGVKLPYTRQIEGYTYFKNIGPYKIKIDDIEKTIILSDPPDDLAIENNIFHCFSLYKNQTYFYKGKYTSYSDEEIIISGSNVGNINLFNNNSNKIIKLSESQKNKIIYILEIANAHKSSIKTRKINNHYIKTEIESLNYALKKLGDNFLYEFFNRVFKLKQNKINNLQFLYLCEISKILKLRCTYE